jgi:CopG family nickel-responsive transcriptional regulator
MERFTISLDESLASAFDTLIAARGYGNRSEAVRDLIRSAIESDRQRAAPSGHCVANLSYVYNHHERELSERLTELQHQHHDLTVAALHAHLDHVNCIESVILKGPTAQVRQFADA